MAVRSQLAAELLQEKARQYRKVASWLTARCLIKHLRKVGSEGECPPPIDQAYDSSLGPKQSGANSKPGCGVQ